MLSIETVDLLYYNRYTKVTIDRRPTMFYLVEDYEQNPAYDSYFYATLFDPETKEIFTQEYGSTA